jgi:hypothetical protein
MPDRPGMSEDNRRALGAMLAAHITQSTELARAHLAQTRPGVSWDDLTVDEQATAIRTAHPWLLAARAIGLAR